MKLKTIQELWFLILLNGLLAAANPQNYGQSRNQHIRNFTPTNIMKKNVESSKKQNIINGTSNGCNSVFCESDPNYPKEFIRTLNLDKFEHLFGDDFIDTISVRFDADEQGLCQSRRRLIYPKKGLTAAGSWLTIVNNDDKYRQGILVEECTRQYSRCDYSDNFPLSVHATCKQNFVYRNLLAIGPDGKPIMEHFQFPSCCKCFITVGHRSNYQPDPNPIRFGSSNEEKEDENLKRDRYIFSN